MPSPSPDDAFNADDVAVILVNGARYGGQWALNAWPVKDGRPSENPVGEIFTEKTDRPDVAVDAAYVWINDACTKAGMKLAHFVNKNSEYGPNEAPFFAAALFVVDRRA